MLPLFKLGGFSNFTVNDRASLLTRIQKTFLDYHFKVEQEAGSATFAFFSFNGTAGVWRREAINDAGGWKDRTTVEDMDLAVRATLKGWKFVYVGDVRVKSELPSTYEAYCRQQFRWACGSANLFRKMAWEVLVAKLLPGATSRRPHCRLHSLQYYHPCFRHDPRSLPTSLGCRLHSYSTHRRHRHKKPRKSAYYAVVDFVRECHVHASPKSGSSRSARAARV